LSKDEGEGKLEAKLEAAEEIALEAEFVEVKDPTSENEEIEEVPVYNEFESSEEAEEEVVELCRGSCCC